MTGGPSWATLWGGRFGEDPDEALRAFTTSLPYDRRLWPYDVRVSLVHARLLERAGLVSPEQAERIVEGLEAVARELGSAGLGPQAPDEDVHSAIERLLVERIGADGQRLHTGRSRNDQVATDLRMFVRDATDALDGACGRLQEALLRRAEEEAETPMPGLTHLQPAQPVTLGHHLMAYVAMLFRDRERLREARRRCNRLPLGAGALAGSGFALDREWAAGELGFEGLCENSMDAVSDRDFVAEFLFACALVMVHLSRLGEEMVIWNHPLFGFIELPDRLATGSSMMPQKKNPDAAELMRGRAGRVLGHLAGFLATLKGLPLTYNRDLQEDKEPVFDAFDQTHLAVEMARRLVEGVRFRRDRMRQACGDDLLATELADYLARKGVPFREAHHEVGRIVAYALSAGKPLGRLSLEELRSFSSHFGPDVMEWLKLEAALARRRVSGGTAPQAVREAIAAARARLAQMAAG